MGLTQRRCRNCHKWFWAYGEHYYCSRKCYNEFRQKQRMQKRVDKIGSGVYAISTELHTG